MPAPDLAPRIAALPPEAAPAPERVRRIAHDAAPGVTGPRKAPARPA